ncbi:protein of unknown function (plasmid) [Cupriavidus neocaledonicus]|uniref:Uncharacterized protein n=1 Tax=Cupriavidus neocaledonicus TaxID=1040979 RepID=A0A375HQL4_9BURK|nr:protein of unknown function [Cupriavidus neocaledonicus]
MSTTTTCWPSASAPGGCGANSTRPCRRRWRGGPTWRILSRSCAIPARRSSTASSCWRRPRSGGSRLKRSASGPRAGRGGWRHAVPARPPCRRPDPPRPQPAAPRRSRYRGGAGTATAGRRRLPSAWHASRPAGRRRSSAAAAPVRYDGHWPAPIPSRRTGRQGRDAAKGAGWGAGGWLACVVSGNGSMQVNLAAVPQNWLFNFLHIRVNISKTIFI